jgi:hypothetical protein
VQSRATWKALAEGIVGNRAIESAAIQWIITLVRTEGRKAVDIGACGGIADIQARLGSLKSRRMGICSRSGFVVGTTQVETAVVDGDFWLYTVERRTG